MNASAYKSDRWKSLFVMGATLKAVLGGWTLPFVGYIPLMTYEDVGALGSVGTLYVYRTWRKGVDGVGETHPRTTYSSGSWATVFTFILFSQFLFGGLSVPGTDLMFPALTTEKVAGLVALHAWYAKSMDHKVGEPEPIEEELPEDSEFYDFDDHEEAYG